MLREELLLTRGVVTLGRHELAAVVSNGVLGLHEDCACAVYGGVGNHLIRKLRVRELEHRGGDEGFFDASKGSGLPLSPHKRSRRLCEFDERRNQRRKALNKAAEVVGKTQEGAELGEVSGGLPVTDDCGFLGVHTEAIAGDDVAQEFEFMAEEL